MTALVKAELLKLRTLRSTAYAGAGLLLITLLTAGVPVAVHLWKGQVHAFPVLGDLLPESSAALDQVAGFVEEALGVRRLRAVS